MLSDSEENRYPLIDLAYSPGWDFKDRVATFGIEMVLAHNIFIRGLNSIWFNAPFVKEADEVAFAGYSLAWVEFLQHHHHSEETVIFPFLQSKLKLTQSLDQHATFRNGLLAFKEYMKKIYEGAGRHSATKTRELVEAFGDAFVQNLHDEISAFSPERLSRIDKKEFYYMAQVQLGKIRRQPITRTVIFVLTHHDKERYPSWPPVPGIVTWILLGTVYWWNRRYGPYPPHLPPGSQSTNSKR